MHHERDEKNAPGPFYVEAGCCTACGVPEATAPDLFGFDAESNCFVRRQPRTAQEIDRMLLTMIRADLGCIRYSGQDDRITQRLAEQGEGALSDIAPPGDIRRIDRDHVGLRNLRQPATADMLMDAFIAHVQRGPMPERYKFEVLARTTARCELRVAWFEDRFHSITFERSPAPEFDWLIVGLGYFVCDWLAEAPMGEATFFERSDWDTSRSFGTALPW